MDAEAYLHIVMDAYHGDVVSLPGRLEVVRDAPAASDDAAAGAGPSPHPLVTVRVEASEPMPDPPVAEGWHVRFVGRNRALDARTSDGTLKSFAWQGSGFTATLDAGTALSSLGLGPDAAARRVTHVLVVPELRRE